MNKIKPATVIYYLFSLFAMLLTNTGCAKHSPIQYQVDALSITPEFAVVRKPNLITVTAAFTDDFPKHAEHKLLLEQLVQRHNDRPKYRSVAQLRDDGEKGDQQEDDGIFTAVFSVTPAIEQSIHYRLVFKPERHHSHFKKPEKILLGSLELPVKNGCGPVGEILPLKIITPDRHKHQYVYQFDIPEVNTIPRETIVKIVNGAQVNAPSKSRIDHATITLNGHQILKLKKSVDIAEIPVKLKTGRNTLTLSKVHGKEKGKQFLAIAVNACADNISVKAIDHTLLAGSERLPATASLTAYGLPVANAEIKFQLNNGLTDSRQQTASTDTTGVASRQFSRLNPGNGRLTASVTGANPALIDYTDFKVIAKPSITLNQGFQTLELISGSEENVPFFLFYLLKNAGPQQLSVRLEVTPDNGGITLSGSAPATDYTVNAPASFSIEPVITGVHPGDYLLTAIASNITTDEIIKKTTRITVKEPGAPAPLVLGAPGLTPSGIPPGSSQIVTVRALAQKSSTPPKRIWLDEVDSDGQLITANLSELKDDGRNNDNVAGDQEYTGQLSVDRADAQNIFVRVRANYSGHEVVSSSRIFSITPFPLQGPPADQDQLFVDDEKISVFANELLVKLHPDTSPRRAEQIVSSINGEILSIIPELQLYRIRFSNNGDLAALQQSIATLNQFLDVIEVSKNTLATTDGTNCNWSNPAKICPTEPLYTNGQQWHINKIQAKQAWYAARDIDSTNFAGSPAFPVAVIDNGVDCNQVELSGHCSATNNNTTGSHATKVAALIAAESNGQNGVGVAWNSTILSFHGGTDAGSLAGAITAAGNSSARILNISMTTQTNAPSTLRDAVCTVATKGKLIVAAAGQPLETINSGRNYYPAALNSDPGNCPANNSATVKLADHIFAVGATDSNDNRATWIDSGLTFGSNQVDWIDLYAPGTEIIALAANEGDQNGTSFASPQVSAAAAMLWPVLPAGTTASALHQRLIDNADLLNDIDGDGIQDKRLNIKSALGSHKLTINFINESADFHNSFGIYNRASGQARLLIDNVDLNSNPSINSFESIHYLTSNELANLEFFLIPNGATINASYLQSTPDSARSLAIFQDSDGKWRLHDTNSGIILRGPTGEADALFSETNRNPDNHVHTLTNGGSNNFHLFWEDRPAPISDFDYNDAEFSVIIQ